MSIKNNKGYVATDMAVAIIGIIVFSGLIISLMYNNFLTNAKVKKETIAVIYLTEIMENVRIATYEQVPLDEEEEKDRNLYKEKIEKLKPEELREGGKFKDAYKVDIKINVEEGIETDIIRKINATISYTVRNKT